MSDPSIIVLLFICSLLRHRIATFFRGSFPPSGCISRHLRVKELELCELTELPSSQGGAFVILIHSYFVECSHGTVGPPDPAYPACEHLLSTISTYVKNIFYDGWPPNYNTSGGGWVLRRKIENMKPSTRSLVYKGWLIRDD